MSSFSKFNSMIGKKIGAASDVSKLAPIVAKWEGGYVDDPMDRGGATNMGVTINTWRLVGYDKNGDGKIDKTDMKLLTHQDFSLVLRRYWDKWQGDLIKNQSIANILVDWYWGSGKWGIVIPQRLLGVKDDGDAGPRTIEALNAAIDKDARKLFDDIYAARVKFLNDIVRNSVAAYEKKIGRKATAHEKKKYTQERFIKGWLNRLADFKFKE